jgi:hypothetical protein
MAEGSKWTPGKIFLLIAGILAGLTIICCGAGWLMFGDKIMAGIEFGKGAAAYAVRLQKDFGNGAAFNIEHNDQGEMVLAIAVTDELTPQRVTEVQDTAWRSMAECFKDSGFLPVKQVAVGRPSAAGKQRSNAPVIGWAANCVTVEEIVKRTGVPAPPLVKFLPEEFAEGTPGVKVKVSGGGEEDGGKEAGDKEDGGGEGK